MTGYLSLEYALGVYAGYAQTIDRALDEVPECVEENREEKIACVYVICTCEGEKQHDIEYSDEVHIRIIDVKQPENSSHNSHSNILIDAHRKVAQYIALENGILKERVHKKEQKVKEH